jgi:hypothetical protein
LNTGNTFYGGAGLVSGEAAGAVNDFGSCLYSDGLISAGTGNPDIYVNSAFGNNDGQPHIVSFVRRHAIGTVSLYVDGTLCGVNKGGTQSLTSPAQLVLGAQQTLYNYLTGDIAEVKIYNGALTDNDRMADENSLRCKYALGSGGTLPAPSGLTGSAGNRVAILTWNPLVSVSNYDVFRSTDNGATYILRAAGLATTNFTDTGAVNGQTNLYKVAAANSCGIGTNSAPVAVFLPLPVLNLNLNSGAFNLVWPGWASDWKLYSASNLVPPVNWTLVANPATSNNNQFMLSLPFSSGSQFFRLSNP